MSVEDSSFDTIVIGSGMGGMTAARLLQDMRGDQVLVLERHTVVGGMTHEFVRRTGLGEFAFSTGLHYLGDEDTPTAPRTLISFLTGGAMQWSRLPDFYDVYETPEGRFAIPSSFDEMVKDLSKRFPSEQAAIERYFFKDVPAAAKQLIQLNVANSLPASLRRFVFPIAKSLSKLALTTTKRVIDERFKDPKLKSILGFQWGDYGRSPQHTAFGIHARIINHYSHGAVYPIGGSMRIARKTVDMIERNDGEVRVGQEVQSILVENGRATGVVVRDVASGAIKELRAKNVVSSAGAMNTYKRLLPPEYGREAVDALTKLGSTISAIVLFVGFKHSPEELSFDGANHWTFIDGDHEASAMAPPGEGPLYFSFASLKNPAARSHVAEIVSLCDLSHFSQWSNASGERDDASYQAMKQEVADRVIERAEQLYPGFKELVEYAELATPLTFKTYQNSVDGAFYGLPASPDRLLSPYATPRTPIKGLYLAGQDALIPGIIGAAAGGARCAAIMLGGDKTPAVFKTITRRSKEKPTGPWNGFLQISRIIDETPTVRSFYLTGLDGAELPFGWKPGQYLNVYLPTDGAKTIRSYSISSAAGQFDSRELRLTIKREASGVGSPFFHDKMIPGDLIEVAGPHGSFTFEKGDAKKLALIGGGVGVTPLMSVLEHLYLEKAHIPITAIFAFKSQEEIVFNERLTELVSEIRNLTVVITISDEEDAKWTGRTGRIDAELIKEFCPDIKKRRVHLCGPVPMMEALTKTLSELGLPSSELRTESFGATTPKPRSEKGKEFTIKFKRSDKQASGKVGDTILDVALREKVVIPHSCGVGTCGTCRMKVLTGEFEAPPTDMLSKKDVENGFVLACQTRPQTDVEIDI